MGSLLHGSRLQSDPMDQLSAHGGVDPLIERTPVEDAGSATARWYRFQYAVATRYCLDMARADSSLAWVLCEWHTDYALGWKNNTRAIASVKYREPDSGIWTVPRLFSDGGFATLMDRWLDCGQPAECRWMTNGGLDISCRKLSTVCSLGRLESIEGHAEALAERFGHSKQDVTKFLGALRMDSTCPAVEYIRILDIDQHARPLLQVLGMAVDAAHKAYDAVFALVNCAAEGLGTEPPDRWILAEPGALDADSLLASTVSRRLIRHEQVRNAILSASTPAAAVLPPITPPITRLIQKLRKGDLVPSISAAARRARREWTEYERSISAPLPGASVGPNFDKLRGRLTAEAVEAQIKAAESGEPYGNVMFPTMRARAAAIADEYMGKFGIDAQLLMGLIYDLTAQCEIWWSPEFPVDDTAL